MHMAHTAFCFYFAVPELLGVLAAGVGDAGALAGADGALAVPDDEESDDELAGLLSLDVDFDGDLLP